MEFNLCLFKKRIDQIVIMNSPHPVFISLYIPTEKTISEVIDILDRQMASADNLDLPPITRLINSEISSLMSTLYNMDHKRNGVVLFFGEHEGRPYRQVIDPPHPVQSFIFKIEREFYLEPLYQMISADEKYGILVIDLADARLGHLVGSKIAEFVHVRSRVMNDHHHGGMSSLRFERLRDDAINEYFKKVADKCNEAFLDKGMKGLIVGGPAKTKNDFLSGEYLHHELRKLVIGPVDVDRPDEDGLKDAVNAAEGLLSTCQYVQEKRTLDRFWTEAGNDGLAVTGMDQTLDRLKNGQVQTLILSESLDLDTIIRLKSIADRFDTEVLMVGNDEAFAKNFNDNIKVGGILRYK